jgi:hypothetical protein
MKAAWMCITVVGLAGLVAACSSSDSTEPETCDNSTVSGLYGFTSDGLNAFGVHAVVQGIASFDGNGNVTETSTTSTNGSFATLTKTYAYATAAASAASAAAAASGCMVTIKDAGVDFANLFVVHGNAQMTGFSAAPGTNATEQFDRIDGTCSNATLNGAYSILAINGAFGNLFIVASGNEVFDGKGGETEHLTVDKGGTLSTVDEKGTYSLSSDCTGTETDPVAGVIAHIVVVHGGTQIRGIDMTPGATELIDLEQNLK